jgi:hypothetical protein
MAFRLPESLVNIALISEKIGHDEMEPDHGSIPKPAPRPCFGDRKSASRIWLRMVRIAQTFST